jgi:hypothetical protein
MLWIKTHTLILMFVVMNAATASACISGTGDGTSANASSVNASPQYVWTQVAERAAFPPAYNFPVFVTGNEMWAFHTQGNWRSSDEGKSWSRSELPTTKLNSAYQKYVQLGGWVYALGEMEGDYTNMRLSSVIRRTKDFRFWETLAKESNLPARVFYGATVFQNKIWLIGGYDGKRYYNDVWNSADAVHWQRVTERAAWSPRNTSGGVVVFKDRIFLIGGGVIDGERDVNPRAGREIWSSTDGINWNLVTDRVAHGRGGTPVVFNSKLWLIGANRDGNFSRAVLVSEDGAEWRELSAAWSPRGAASAWVFGDKLYMTGGKYSETVNGETRFIYRNDVWRMSAS